MINLSKIVLIVFSAFMLGVAGPVSILADDGNTEYLGSEPLPPSGASLADDGNTEYLGSEPLPPSGASVPQVSRPAPIAAAPAAKPVSGDFTFRYPECDWDNHLVREVWQDSSGNYQYRNVHSEPGQCGAPTQVSQPPAPSPAPSPVPPAPAVGGPVTTTTNVTNNNTNTNVANNTANNTVTNTVQQTQSQSNSQTVNVPAGAPVSGLSVRFATVDCPAGTNKKVSGNEIICEIPQQVQQVKVVTTEVAGVKTEVKELPKTGLPLLAWVAGAFIPAGLGLKRFGQGISFDMEDHPEYLWEERQFKVRA